MKRIVVVDDEPVLASIYRAKFLAEGFHVDVATDGEAALELIERVKPDLVLLDLMLPKIKGIDVLKKVRANPLFKDLPIAVFSNSGQTGAVEDAWAAGASLVLSKSRTSPKQMVESVLSSLSNGGVADRPTPEISDTIPTTKNYNTAPNTSLKRRILLVEINAEVRAILAHILTHAGYQITFADGQSHAALLLDIAHFDLLLLNHALCHESPKSFYHQARRRHSQLPVMMYSMHAGLIDSKEALSAGVSRFLTTPEELLNVAQISATMIEQTQASV
jgi:CheY-like chemotaxis protein